MDPRWPEKMVRGSAVLFAFLVVLKWTLLSYTGSCTQLPRARRRSLTQLPCRVLLQCLREHGQRGDRGLMLGTCKVLRTIERAFDLLPPVDRSMEVMGSVLLLFVVIYREIVCAILEDWGLWGWWAGSWRLGGLLGGGDSEADLPELEEVEAEPEGLPQDKRQLSSWSPALANGHHQQQGRLEESDCKYCERCTEESAAEGMTALKQVTPEGWLVYDKVVGVVPYEVLEHWRTTEEDRRRVHGNGACCGSGENSQGQSRREADGADAGKNHAPAKRRSLPPVRRPPRPKQPPSDR